MVAADVAGIVTDGPDMKVDIDYQLHVSHVTVTFSGYESERDGLVKYEWAVGSAPRFDDVMPYSYIDLLTEDDVAPRMLGKMKQCSMYVGIRDVYIFLISLCK